MASFADIVNSGPVRNIVQTNMLERRMQDALLPAFLFRMDMDEERWEANTGDNKTFTRKGLIKPNQTPIPATGDVQPRQYPLEQWEATAKLYGDSVDTVMPESLLAIADLFLENAQTIGISGGQAMNRVARNVEYNAALSGNTMANGAQSLSGTSGTLAVLEINGFTTARNPALSGAGAAQVKFSPVSPANPLPITIVHSGTEYAANVVGFTGETYTVDGQTYMDTVGPGTLNITYASGSVPGGGTISDRDTVQSNDCTVVIRAGGGNSTDTVPAGGTFTLALIQQIGAQMRIQNVLRHPDRFYHCHYDPISNAQLFNDPAVQRLNTSLPDWYMYREMAVGQILGTVFLENNECPAEANGSVYTNPGASLSSAAAYSPSDPFGGLLVNESGVPIHRPIFTGLGAVTEYWIPLDKLITEAGLNGKVGDPRISNEGIDVFAERLQLIIRAPQDRLQQKVSTSWKYIGDFVVGTDAATGNASRYKRILCVEHGE